MTDTAVAPEESKLEMGIDPYERNWIRLAILLLVVFFAIVSVSGFFMGFQLTGAEQEVDPRTVMEEGPFAQPGLREISPGNYEAYVVARTWLFDPPEIEVPVGSTVTLYVTSADLQHGYKITDTNINMQVVPGQVSKLEYTFDKVGEFPYICTEYCGQGHAVMAGTVKVVSPTADTGAAATDTADTATDGTATTEGASE